MWVSIDCPSPKRNFWARKSPAIAMILFITYIWTFILRLKYKKKEAFSKVLSNNYPLRSSMDSAYDHPDYPLWIIIYESCSMHLCVVGIWMNLLNLRAVQYGQFEFLIKIISQLVALILLSCYSIKSSSSSSAFGSSRVFNFITNFDLGAYKS